MSTNYYSKTLKTIRHRKHIIDGLGIFSSVRIFSMTLLKGNAAQGCSG